MQERKVAVDSLMAVANQLHSAHHALTDKLTGRQDLPEHYILDLFYQSVKSSSDVQDFILRTAARLNLPIKWLPDRIAEQNFNLDEPPTKASAWVGVLLNQHLKVFRERLSTMPTLSTADIDQVRHAPGTARLRKRPCCTNQLLLHILAIVKNMNALSALCYCRTFGVVKHSLRACVCVCACLHM